MDDEEGNQNDSIIKEEGNAEKSPEKASTS